MSELLKNIDARTKLAGTNKLEILLFFLGKDTRTGRRETFGINVFKVREVMHRHRSPRRRKCRPQSRGWSVCEESWSPIIDLAKYAGRPEQIPRATS